MTIAATSDSHGRGPFTLGRDTVLHLASDLTMRRLRVEEDTWAQLGDVAEFGDGRVMSVFGYETSWTWWERHRVGEELVHLLSGEVAFHLDDGTPTVTVLGGGQSLLVPTGAWHTAEIISPASMLFVTPMPAVTEHRDFEIGADG